MSAVKFFLVFLLTFSVFGYSEDKVATIKVFPEDATLEPGKSITFKAKGYDNNEKEVSFDVEWEATGGKVTSKGTYTAGKNQGWYSINAIDPKTGAQGSASVKITYDPKSTKTYGKVTGRVKVLRLSPVTKTLQPGEKLRIRIRAYDAKNKFISPGNISWRVTGGSITPKNSTMALYQAGGAFGTYFIQAKNSYGVTAMAKIVIKGVASKGITRIKVIPSTCTLKPGERKRFFAVGYSSSGQVIPFKTKWQATGGTINKNGVYIAGKTSGRFFAKAIGPGKVSSTARVSVEELTVERIDLVPVSARLVPGQKIKFEVRAYNKFGKVKDILPLWSATGGVIHLDGTYHAGRITGTYSISVTIGGITMKSSITIQKPGKAGSLQIFPKKVTLKIGESVKFKVKLYDISKNRIPASNIQYMVSGGSITPQGKYQAGDTPGKYKLKVSSGKVSTFASIKIVDPDKSKIKWLAIYPPKIKLTPNSKTSFKAHGYDKAGNKIACDVKWKANGGSISKKGMFKAGAKEGTYSITAYVGKITKSATVTVAKKVKKSGFNWKVTPPKVTLKKGQRCIFNVELTDPKGKKLSTEYTWSATGGKIDSSGLFTAGAKNGSYYVTIKSPKYKTSTKVPVRIGLPVASKTKTKTKKLNIIQWKVSKDTIGTIKISLRAEVFDKRAYAARLIAYWDGGKKTLYKLKVSNGQRFRARVGFYLPDITSIGLVIYDAKGKEVVKHVQNLK